MARRQGEGFQRCGAVSIDSETALGFQRLSSANHSPESAVRASAQAERRKHLGLLLLSVKGDSVFTLWAPLMVWRSLQLPFQNDVFKCIL